MCGWGIRGMAQFIFQGTAGNDLLDASGVGRQDVAVMRGLAGNDTLIGSGSNDSLQGGLGNDLLLGGSGFDSALYSSPRASCTVRHNPDGTWSVIGPEGTDTLLDIEVLRFSDQTIPLVAVRHDLDADLRSEILWVNATAAAPGTLLAQWRVQGGSFVSGDTFASLDPGWSVAGTGDFDADGQADMLLGRADGGFVLRLAFNGALGAVQAAGAGVSVAGIGDLDGNGRDDVVLSQEFADAGGALWRTVSVRPADGLAVAGGTIATVEAAWSVVGVADFNLDGQADLLWRHADGSVALWRMSGAGFLGGGTVYNPGADWSVAGTGDFNGDGRADILFRHADGSAAVWLMNGATVLNSGTLFNPGTAWDVAAVGDYDGDGRSDILWRQAAVPGGGTTEVKVWTMNGLTVVRDQSLAMVAEEWRLL